MKSINARHSSIALGTLTNVRGNRGRTPLHFHWNPRNPLHNKTANNALEYDFGRLSRYTEGVFEMVCWVDVFSDEELVYLGFLPCDVRLQRLLSRARRRRRYLFSRGLQRKYGVKLCGVCVVALNHFCWAVPNGYWNLLVAPVLRRLFEPFFEWQEGDEI